MWCFNDDFDHHDNDVDIDELGDDADDYEDVVNVDDDSNVEDAPHCINYSCDAIVFAMTQERTRDGPMLHNLCM